MFDFDLPLCVEFIQGSASRTWNCVSQIANLIWFKLTASGGPNMPRSRRRHHSRSRSRSRSGSHDKDREPKRRKIESYDSPHHRKSVSSESESNEKINSPKILEENILTQREIGGINQKSIVCENSKSEEMEVETIEKHDDQINTLVQGEINKKLGTCENTKSEEVEMAKINDPLLSSTETPATTIQPNQLENPNVPKVDPTLGPTEELATITQTKRNSKTPKDDQLLDEPSLTTQPNQIENSKDPPVSPTKEPTNTNNSENFEASKDLPQGQTEELTTTQPNQPESTETQKNDVVLTKTKNLKNSNTPIKQLTPKQLQKKLESEKKRLEKQKERDDRLKKVQEMKEEKRKLLEQQRLEKEQKKQKEEEEKMMKRKEKEDEKMQRQKEKEEKVLKRKEEEEERKRKREQERIKKQQEIEEKNKEKLKLEEQKQKAAAAFANFFVSKKSDDSKSSDVNEACNFMPFEVKSGMRLAPFARKIITDEQKQVLTELMEKQNFQTLYLKELKDGGREIGRDGRTWPYDDESDDVMIVDDLGESIMQSNTVKMRAKLLKFHENQRPPYFGTWRKKSTVVTPRKPFGNEEIFNYEVDSDEEWEDEVEGESIAGSDEEEKENESENDYEVDNDFFVPHGHLSDDEGGNDEDEKVLDPEAHKTKLKLLKNQFDEERKSKTLKIKPRVFGCIWYNKEDKIDEAMDRHFKPFSVICSNTITIKKREDFVLIKKVEKPGLDKELLPDLLRFVHGNIRRNLRHLVKEYLNILDSKKVNPVPSKSAMSRQIKSFAQWKRCPDEGPLFEKFCWYVDEDTRRNHNVHDLQIPNQ